MSVYIESLLIAIGFFTKVPIPKIRSFEKASIFSPIFYPIVGLLLAGIIIFLYLMVEPFLPQYFLGIFLFSIYCFLYGAIHLDGFADTIDAIFSYKQNNEILKVLKDPNIGAIGSIFSTIFIILKCSTFVFIQNFYLIFIPLVLSRFFVLVIIKYFPTLTNSGMGATIKKSFKSKYLFISFFITLLIIIPFLSFIKTIIFFIIGLLISINLGKYLTKKFTGLNGDMYGFAIEINELFLLILIIIFEHNKI